MHTRRTCVWVTLLGAVLLAAGAAQAQDGRGEQKRGREIVIGEALTIRSEVLDEDRVILVGKPADYDQGNESYPVLFLLDGNDHFHHATGLARSLANNGLMPGLLIVAVDNTVRIRDLTPPARDAQIIRDAPAHGGAERFRSFLARELIPWVDANFRTRPYRILAGHSLGGLFAIDSLLQQPDLFDASIAISPSLQWDNRRTVERADAVFQGRKELNAALFMTVGNEGDALARGVGAFASLLEEQAPPGLGMALRAAAA
ncbi:MAG: alpha/beta hydrolase [Vicinamibacterales bacterium]